MTAKKRKQHFNLEERKAALSELLYGLVRVMDSCGAWLALTPNLELKIFLGKKLGYDALSMQEMKGRLAELGDLGPPKGTEDFSKLLDRVGKTKSTLAISRFLLEFSKDLLTRIDSYQGSVSGCGDELTIGILNRLRSQTVNQIRELKKFDRKVVRAWQRSQSQVLVSYTGSELLPELVSWPHRPSNYRRVDSPPQYESAYHRVFTNEGLVKLLHNLFIDVEIAAAEVCGRNIAEYRKMPLEFKFDMARQCWDEVRHAQLALEQIDRINGKVAKPTYVGQVWSNYMKGTSLSERIAIEQIVSEGAGVDQGIEKVRMFQGLGDFDMAQFYETINSDEKNHVQFGNKWLRFLVNDSEADFDETVERVKKWMSRDQETEDKNSSRSVGK